MSDEINYGLSDTYARQQYQRNFRERNRERIQAQIKTWKSDPAYNESRRKQKKASGGKNK
jgi:hypothetical protein